MGYARAEDTKRVKSSDGRNIPCTFVENEDVCAPGNMMSALLFIFEYLVPKSAYTKGYLLNSAFNAFLSFLGGYNSRSPDSLKVLNVSEISASVFNSFILFCNEKYDSVRYPPALKSALQSTALDTGKIPFLLLPTTSGQRGEATEPLFPDGFETLTAALTTHVDKLYELLEGRKTIDQSEPYTYDEVAKYAFCQISKNDFVYWWRTTTFYSTNHRRGEIERRLKNCVDPELHSLYGTLGFIAAAEKIVETHVLPENLVSHEITDYLPTYSEWYPDDFRVIKTFVEHGYPVNMSTEELEAISGRGCSLVEECDTVVKLLLNRIRHSTGKNRKNVLMPLDWYVYDYYPQSIDMSALTLLIMLQSGWNQETVMSLDKDNYEHPLTGAISSAISIVYGEKNRSQANNKGYDDPEQIFAPSDASNPYSLVSLVRLAKQLSLPLSDIEFDFISELTSEEKLNKLYLFLRDSNDWARAGRHSSASYGKYFRKGVTQFLAEYTVTDNGKRLTAVKDVTLRLRPTWVMHKEQENDLSFVSQRLHHKNRTTTDIFYDNSGQAQQRRGKLLRSELEAVMKIIRSRDFSRLKTTQKAKEATLESKTRLFNIPGKGVMWGCSGGKPSWPGSQLAIPSNEKCYALENCNLCSCQMVFEDSLPFLIERVAHIDEFLDGDAEPSFKNSMASERLSIMEVLDTWEDNQTIREAARYQRKNSPLLPQDLSLLKMIFRTGDL